MAKKATTKTKENLEEVKSEEIINVDETKAEIPEFEGKVETPEIEEKKMEEASETLQDTEAETVPELSETETVPELPEGGDKEIGYYDINSESEEPMGLTEEDVQKISEEMANSSAALQEIVSNPETMEDKAINEIKRVDKVIETLQNDIKAKEDKNSDKEFMNKIKKMGFTNFWNGMSTGWE